MYKWEFLKSVYFHNPALERMDILEAKNFFKNKTDEQVGLIVNVKNKKYIIESYYLWIDFIEKGYWGVND